MYGVENRFKMKLLLGLKRPHCEMGIQQLRTTSRVLILLGQGVFRASAQQLLHGPAEENRHHTAVVGWSLGHWFVAAR